MSDALTGPMADIVKQLDGVIAAALTARLGEGWIIPDLKGRLTRITWHGDERETYCLDGKPMFSVSKVRLAHEYFQDRYKFTLTQDFKHFEP